MTFINPLDLETIFVGHFAGSITIFIFLALIIIGILSAKFRMPNIVFLSMAVLFLSLTGIYYAGIWVTGIVVVGILLGVIITRFIK